MDTEASSEGEEESELPPAPASHPLAAIPCLAPEDLLSLEGSSYAAPSQEGEQPPAAAAAAGAQPPLSTVAALAQWRRGEDGEEARRRSTIDIYGLIAWAGPVERERRFVENPHYRYTYIPCESQSCSPT